MVCFCRCFPTGFISRRDINPVVDACLTVGRCIATTGSTNLNNAFDTSFYTGEHYACSSNRKDVCRSNCAGLLELCKHMLVSSKTHYEIPITHPLTDVHMQVQL
jgi:hypothetical protein